ncbi:hypothetical protein Ciccas_014195, partial [Cichlidogyrus casuarinus]
LGKTMAIEHRRPNPRQEIVHDDRINRAAIQLSLALRNLGERAQSLLLFDQQIAQIVSRAKMHWSFVKSTIYCPVLQRKLYDGWVEPILEIAELARNLSFHGLSNKFEPGGQRPGWSYEQRLVELEMHLLYLRRYALLLYNQRNELKSRKKRHSA